MPEHMEHSIITGAEGGGSGHCTFDYKCQIPDSTSYIPDSKIPNSRSRIPDPKNQIPDSTSQIPDPRSQILHPGSWIPDSNCQMLDSTFYFPDSKSQLPDPRFHILHPSPGSDVLGGCPPCSPLPLPTSLRALVVGTLYCMHTPGLGVCDTNKQSCGDGGAGWCPMSILHPRSQNPRS